jgi:hypothetical protein
VLIAREVIEHIFVELPKSTQRPIVGRQCNLLQPREVGQLSAMHDRIEHFQLVFEVPVNGTPGKPSPPGNVLERRSKDALAQEAQLGGIQDAFTCALALFLRFSRQWSYHI